MSVYTSSRAETYKKLKQQSRSLGVGSSGTSVEAMERDMQRNIALESAAQMATKPMPTNPVRRQTTTSPATGGTNTQAAAGNTTTTKKTSSTGSTGNTSRHSGYVSIYGPKALYTSAGNLASGNGTAAKTAAASKTSGYVPTYGANALYTSAGNTAEEPGRKWYDTALDI